MLAAALVLSLAPAPVEEPSHAKVRQRRVGIALGATAAVSWAGLTALLYGPRRTKTLDLGRALARDAAAERNDETYDDLELCWFVCDAPEKLRATRGGGMMLLSPLVLGLSGASAGLLATQATPRRPRVLAGVGGALVGIGVVTWFVGRFTAPSNACFERYVDATDRRPRCLTRWYDTGAGMMLAGTAAASGGTMLAIFGTASQRSSAPTLSLGPDHLVLGYSGRF